MAEVQYLNVASLMLMRGAAMASHRAVSGEASVERRMNELRAKIGATAPAKRRGRLICSKAWAQALGHAAGDYFHVTILPEAA